MFWTISLLFIVLCSDNIFIFFLTEGYHINEFAFSAMKAIVLLCKKIGWQNTYNDIICDRIWVDIERFLLDTNSVNEASMLLYLIGMYNMLAFPIRSMFIRNIHEEPSKN